MRIAVTGSSGFIGSHLIPFLKKEGHDVVALKRDQLDLSHLEGFEAVIHLAGESVLGYWTAAKKQRIRESRLGTTARLVAAFKQMKKPPATFICASAVGFYGSRGDEILTEESTLGSGFLADLCQQWEAIAQIAAGVTRVVNLRIGIVLSPDGGMLAKMRPIFNLGLGGRMGPGKEWMSWIALDDLLRMISCILKNKALSGPVNGVAPNPIIQKEFVQSLAHSLHRPAFFHLPRWLLRGILNEVADETIFASTRASPKKMIDSGFIFNSNYLNDFLNN